MEGGARKRVSVPMERSKEIAKGPLGAFDETITTAVDRTASYYIQSDKSPIATAHPGTIIR